MLQRRIELCGDAPRAPLQPCKRRVRPPTGGPPAQGRSTPEQAQSEKSQGVRGTESPDPSITDQRNRELRVRFFGGTTNPAETILTPQNVNANGFGLVRNLPVDGQVYAQPLYASSTPVSSAGQSQGLHNLLIVATEHDSVYAFDADSGTLYWHVSMLGAGEVPSDPIDCTDLGPEVGITSTP